MIIPDKRYMNMLFLHHSSNMETPELYACKLVKMHAICNHLKRVIGYFPSSFPFLFWDLKQIKTEKIMGQIQGVNIRGGRITFLYSLKLRPWSNGD